jgi:hypothetical protein
MRTIITGAALVTAAIIISAAAALPFAKQATLISPLDVAVTGIQDSTQYYAYTYSVHNPPQSIAGVAWFDIDISTGPGSTQPDPAATGQVQYATIRPDRWRVPIGPIVPDKWKAFVGHLMAVYDTTPGYLDTDTISPGDVLLGLGLRSPYLPGIRQVRAHPTVQSCCMTPLPDPDTGMPCDTTTDRCFFPAPVAWRRSSFTVAPTYAPSGMSLTVVESLKNESCGTLNWITNSTTCAKLQQRIELAGAALGSSTYPVARAQLDAFVTELEARHHATQTQNVNDNAYWMLSTNAKHIRFKSLPPAACQTITPLNFVADQTLTGGEIRIRNGEINLIIDLVMASGWTLGESHVAVDHDLSGIPQGNVGALQYGVFPYSTQHAPGTTSYTYVIPLSSLGATANARLFLAVHGNVKQGATDREAWADGTRTIPTGTDSGMYFTYTVTSC